MKSFKQYITEKEQDFSHDDMRTSIQTWTDHLSKNSKGRLGRMEGAGQDGLLNILSHTKPEHAKRIVGHGAKTIEGLVTLLHGMGDHKKGLHSMPFHTEPGAGGGFGASAPYMGTHGGLLFHHSNLDKAIGVWVNPESELRDHVSHMLGGRLPVVHTDEVHNFINDSATKVDSEGKYVGPTLDIFGKTRNTQK